MDYSTTITLFDIKHKNVRKIWHYSFVDFYTSVKMFLFFFFLSMRRVADTVPEELCVYTLPCGADNELYFFGSGSTVRITDILSP